MSRMNSMSVYVGGGNDGEQLEQRVNAMVLRRRSAGNIKSRSELLRQYVEHGLDEDEKKYPPLESKNGTATPATATAA